MVNRWAAERWKQLEAIDQQLAGAEHSLARIEEAVAKLEAAGMYDAIPTEAWESKNGGPARYLYLYFGFCGEAGRHYWGPDGKRKVYVGNKPERIAEALRLVHNRRKWEELNTVRERLDRWVREYDLQLRITADRARYWTGHVPAELWEPGDPEECLQVAEAYLESLDIAQHGGAAVGYTLL